MGMDAKIINAFLTEGINTFQDMFNIGPENKDPHLLDIHAGHPWEISGLLGVTGEVKGIVAFRLHKILANKMLELSGIQCKPEDYEDMAIGLVSEFTNIISGHAVTALIEYNLDILRKKEPRIPTYKIDALDLSIFKDNPVLIPGPIVKIAPF